MKYRDLYDIGKTRLANAGIEEAELDARLLLEAVCKTARHDLLVNGDREIKAELVESYLNHITAR
ncbi:MAG: peptide chain release factor N(5)-glutamine methyltransferase, partial [Lachnospiraceae bacterium]|nr:peptide chain release factor N(5)-glutamine methyltransferase [Lachnospiraceae bacterium]